MQLVIYSILCLKLNNYDYFCITNVLIANNYGRQLFG